MGLEAIFQNAIVALSDTRREIAHMFHRIEVPSLIITLSKIYLVHTQGTRLSVNYYSNLRRHQLMKSSNADAMQARSLGALKTLGMSHESKLQTY
jgi:hypothetical protein